MVSPQISLIVFVIDIADTLTLDTAKEKLHETIVYNNQHRQVPMLVLCNKTDLVTDYRYFVANKKIKNTKPNNRLLGSNEDTLLNYLGLENRDSGLVLDESIDVQFELDLHLVSLRAAHAGLQQDLVSWMTKP
ncbi:hypothetical protein OGAPHI_003320 [Ogataea philodendri]|uniref:Signal recognition particle receptor subunit beta n=1 Tax=Ogataea philodendri TaxID=1378263 RepID=A0A9P8T5J9_9ASCO|nr:uncharacterized protein OGAPHI_003320 [Ogataea philodendri]KAH3666871.1 hypothetical protein OGAPHI_003320 [Ogataea philodendri]